MGDQNKVNDQEDTMDLQSLLGQALGGDTIGRMSQALGADERTTGNAVQAALPMLLGALAHNSSTPTGASSLLGALDRDHDGSVLDDVAGFLGGGSSGSGQGILGHVFGNKLGAVQNGLGQASGLDAGSAGNLLTMLAPIVMGALGRTNRQGGLDVSSLGGLLGGASQQLAGADSSMLGGLSQLLDSNQDGSSLDDVVQLAAKFFTRRGA
jgi:hypothetical protein